MIKYTLRRLIQAIPTLFGITILVFMLMTLVPGGPTAALSGDPKMTPQQKARIARQMGVNDPWPVQYLRWLIGDQWRQIDTDDDGVPDQQGTRLGILRGDFGSSFSQRRPVLDIITERIPATLELGLASLFFGIVIGVPIGIIAAVKHGGWFDSVTRIVAVVFNAIPVFWLGLILILLFGALLPQWLHNANPGMFPTVSPILPMGGRGPSVLTGGIPPIYQRLQYLILPTFVLATGGIAGYSRYMRASMLDVIGQDYIRTAKAKGLSMRQVWFKHGARNALMPLATFLGPAITGLLAGAAITERIFSWPGLGRLALDAVTSLDYPVVMAVVILSAVATILGFVLSDVLYALIDPRIRFS